MGEIVLLNALRADPELEPTIELVRGDLRYLYDYNLVKLVSIPKTDWVAGRITDDGLRWLESDNEAGFAIYTLGELPEPANDNRIHQVNLSRKWYGENMRNYVDAFEDGTIDLPRDKNIADDHRAVEDVDGIPMVPKLERKDLKEPELVRHGDSAIAGALLWFASLNRAAPIEWTPVPDKSSRWDAQDNDSDLSIQSGGGW